MSSFFLMMVLYPEVQKKVQDELDRVVGTERLPSLEDRGNLPYTDAVLKETLRLNPVAPLGIEILILQSSKCNYLAVCRCSSPLDEG